jgi:hypothetical protein
MMGVPANQELKSDLEDFLTSSLHYWHQDYRSSYSDRVYNCFSDSFNSVGLGAFKVGEILHPLEAGYYKFWKLRNKGAKIWNKSVKKYVTKFFAKYCPKGKGSK